MRPKSLGGYLQRFVRRNRTVTLGLVLLAVPLACALFAPWLAPHDPEAQQLTARLLPPAWQGGSPQYLLGTDGLGRDLLSRIIFGARVSFVVGLTVVVIGGSLGTVVGLVAGYAGGIVDAITMRIIDVFLAFPFLLLALAVMAVLGPGLLNVILVLGFTSWVPYARVTRARVLAVKEREFVEATRAMAVPSFSVVFRHILPNVASSVIIIASFRVASAIVSEATLSFLGLGVPSSVPSWGSTLSDGRTYLLIAWWPATLPGLAIMLTVLGANLLGDGIRDALDPRTHKG